MGEELCFEKSCQWKFAHSQPVYARHCRLKRTQSFFETLTGSKGLHLVALRDDFLRDPLPVRKASSHHLVAIYGEMYGPAALSVDSVSDTV